MSRVYHLYSIIMYTHISTLTSKIFFTLIYNEAISPPCRPPSSLVVMMMMMMMMMMSDDPKKCLKLAENRAASSLWVGAHRYTRVSCV